MWAKFCEILSHSMRYCMYGQLQQPWAFIRINEPHHEKTFLFHMWMTKAQISLCICSLIQTFKILASYCSWAGLFESVIMQCGCPNKTPIEIVLLCLHGLVLWYFRIQLLFGTRFALNSGTAFCVEYEPQHDKTNKMTGVPSWDSDQPGHSASLIRVFIVCMKKA